MVLGAVILAATAAQAAPDLSEKRLEGIAPLVEAAIQAKKIPGAVVLIGHDGQVVYRKAFGERSLVPERRPMTVDTIFDMASMTKVVATTTAVMQLVEQGKIELSAPVSDYWPEFKQNGKELVTIRELMTHYSGLPPDLELKPAWTGYDTAMKMIVAAKLDVPPGTRFIYSDINFETLGEIVRRVSGETLDVYCAEHIFGPLGMKDTLFKPPASLRSRIAPTQYEHGTSGPVLWGVVHDPTSRFMGGVAGHAGLFSTADDLSIFAQMLLEWRHLQRRAHSEPAFDRKDDDAADSSRQDGVARPRLGYRLAVSPPTAASCSTWARLGTPATRELPSGLIPSPRPT